MGSTIYSEHKVFKMDLGINEGVLFGSETVIVASKHCEKNVYPHSYGWSIEFVGSVDTFVNRYLPETAYFYDDGLSQASYIGNGKQFQEHLKQLYNTAGILTLDELLHMGFYGYSWPDEGISKIKEAHNLKEFTYYLGKRHGRVFKTEQDVALLIEEAYAMAPSDGKYIWLSSLWRLDFERATTISNIDHGTVLETF